MNILFSHIRLSYENRTATLLLRDGQGGAMASVQKRPPVFSGR